MDSYATLYRLEKARGNYPMALLYHERYETYEDSIFDEEKSLQIAEMNVRFSVERQERENDLLKQQQVTTKAILERQVILIFTGVILLLSVLVFAIVLYRENQQKIKTNELLQKQKKELDEKRMELELANEKLSIQKGNITDSIHYAKRIQSAMLPDISEIRKDFPEVIVLYKPKDIVSGDFYWYLKKDDVSYMACVDCTGHGVPGALMSMIGDTALSHIISKEKFSSVGDILTEMDQYVRSVLRQNKTGNVDGMDMALCAINHEEQQIAFAGAKMGLTIVSDCELKVLKGNRRSIGGEYLPNQNPFEEHVLKIDKGSFYYMYTDGLEDQFGGESGKKLKPTRFRNELKKIHKFTGLSQYAYLTNFIGEWKGYNEQVDDILVMGFGFNETGNIEKVNESKENLIEKI